jgi:iron(III) transport system substrate-binding protein
MGRTTTVLVTTAILCSLAVANLYADDQGAILAGAKKEGALVVYTSMSVDQAQRIMDVFQARYPFLKTTMFRAVGERLLTKIMTEAQAGKYDFDAVQSAESQAYFLKKKNLLQKYVSPKTKNIQKPFFDSEGYWTAVYIMPNVIAYNTRMVKRNEVPKTDEDLLNPKWKGKIGMDHTKPEWFAWKLKHLGEEKGLAYMKKLGAQEFRLYAGLSVVTNLLALVSFH